MDTQLVAAQMRHRTGAIFLFCGRKNDRIKDLLPWSKSLPPDCRKKKASN